MVWNTHIIYRIILYLIKAPRSLNVSETKTKTETCADKKINCGIGISINQSITGREAGHSIDILVTCYSKDESVIFAIKTFTV